MLRRRRRGQSRRYSPLTRRILLLNIVPVVLLALGAVYLSDYEDELIDAELASLLVQGEMVAAGIGEVAVVGGETTVNRLDVETARQLLTRLVRPTGVRARLFSETGELLGDSAVLGESGRIHVAPLPPPETPNVTEERLGDRVGDWLARQLSRSDRYPEYVNARCRLRDFPGAASARSFNASAVRIVTDGPASSAAVPVQRYKRVLGALMLTATTAPSPPSLRKVRYDMLTIAVAALGITVLLSLYLPARSAADRAGARRRRDPPGPRKPAGIPRPGKRGDEIGDLNVRVHTKRPVAAATPSSFAADVAHELKNPLTSLRSAIEVAARPGRQASAATG